MEPDDKLVTCAYEAHQDEPETWHGNTADDWQLDTDSWTCNHTVRSELIDSEAEDQFCVFHTDPADVPEEIDEAKAFVHAINEQSSSGDEADAKEKKEFVGAIFGTFEIEHGTTIDAGDEYPIRLSHAVFQNGISADGVTFKQGVFARGIQSSSSEDISFDSAEFSGDGDISFTSAEFSGDGGISFTGTEFGGDSSVLFNSVEFNCDGRVSFTSAEFSGDSIVSFIDAEFSGDGDISFNGAEFSGDGGISFASAEFSGDGTVSFVGTEFSGDGVVFNSAEFSGDGGVSFSGAEFGCDGDVSFKSAKFSGDSISFMNTEFSDDSWVAFDSAEFSSDSWVAFDSVEFNGDSISFDSAEFNGDSISFDSAEFSGGSISFDSAEFNGDSISFDSVEFSGDGIVSFRSAEFSSDSISFTSAEFSAGSISFTSADFGGDVSFDDVVCSSSVEIEADSFHCSKKVSFVNADFANCDFRVDSMAKMDLEQADFSGVNLSDVDFSDARLELAVFSRTVLYGSNFSGAALDGASFGNAQVNESTTFVGVEPDSNERETVFYDPEHLQETDTLLNRLNSTISRYLPRRPVWSHDPRSPPPAEPRDTHADQVETPIMDDQLNSSVEIKGGLAADSGNIGKTSDGEEDWELEYLQKAARTYHTIEKVGRENSLPDLQTVGFIRRQEMHRYRYAEQASTTSNGSIGYWGKWLRASVARLTLLYGESPWRVIAVALSVILTAALLYPLGGFRHANGGVEQAESLREYISILPDSLYFSTLTFTTLGFGDFQPYTWGRWLATMETALGATLIALLVFVLGRRAAR